MVFFGSDWCVADLYVVGTQGAADSSRAPPQPEGYMHSITSV